METYNYKEFKENDFSDILLCDNFILKADIYNISIKTSIDIEGMTRRETGFYYFGS